MSGKGKEKAGVEPELFSDENMRIPTLSALRMMYR